jgi:hypothetical protein
MGFANTKGKNDYAQYAEVILCASTIRGKVTVFCAEEMRFAYILAKDASAENAMAVLSVSVEKAKSIAQHMVAVNCAKTALLGPISRKKTSRTENIVLVVSS